MTTALKCDFCAMPFVICAVSSELQLHQVGVVARIGEAAQRQVVGQITGFGEFSDGHGGFVAGVAPGTVRAVFLYFVVKGLMVGDAEVEVFEEGRDACEEADALDATGFGLIDEGVDEKAASSASLGVGIDDDRADLSEVLAVDVECRAADELSGAGFDDGEGVDVGADLRIRAVEEGAVGGEALDQLMDGVGVVQVRFTRSQGCCFDLVFCCDEGDCE